MTPEFTEIIASPIATQELEELSPEGHVFDQQQFESRPENRIVVPETLDHAFRVVQYVLRVRPATADGSALGTAEHRGRERLIGLD